jgi:hypothetical protein
MLQRDWTICSKYFNQLKLTQLGGLMWRSITYLGTNKRRVDDKPREPFKLVISHNQSTHGQILRIRNDIISPWMKILRHISNNLSSLKWEISYGGGEDLHFVLPITFSCEVQFRNLTWQSTSFEIATGDGEMMNPLHTLHVRCLHLFCFISRSLTLSSMLLLGGGSKECLVTWGKWYVNNINEVQWTNY